MLEVHVQVKMGMVGHWVGRVSYNCSGINFCIGDGSMMLQSF